jgi:uncharacterized protein YuzE
MKLKVDQRADALYLTLTDAPARRSEAIAPGIIVDYDQEGSAIGIEVLSLSKWAPGIVFDRLEFESV